AVARLSGCKARTTDIRYLTLRLVADSLPRLLSISYSMVCPSLSERSPARSTAEMWTNTSLLPPPEGCINPYPFDGMNHLTVPVGIAVSNVDRAHNTSRARAGQGPKLPDSSGLNSNSSRS